MPKTPRALIELWFKEVWEEGNFAAAEEILHPDCKAYGFPTPEASMDREVFLAYVQNFRRTFTDVRIVLHDIIESDDRIAVRLTAHMVHTGDGLGFPATGEPVKITGVSMNHFADGKLIAGWNFYDVAGEVSRLAHLTKSRET